MSDAELFSPEFSREPGPFYARWRQEAPIWWSERLGGWVTSRHTDVRTILTDYATFQQWAAFHKTISDFLQYPVLSSLNPPDHTHMRGAFKDAFRPSHMREKMGAIVEQVVAETIADLPKGRFDVVKHLASPVARRVVGSLLGTQASDETMRRFEQALISTEKSRLNMLDDETRAKTSQASDEFIEELEARCRSREHRPENDLLTSLVQMGRAAGIEWKGIVALAGVLLQTGHDTTARGIATTVHALCTHPEQLSIVLKDESFASKAFEEGIRLEPPANVRARQVAKETSLHGTTLAEGQPIFVLVGSANRDPEHYERPDDFWVERHEREGDHLSFGAGIHFCIGAPLSRMEGATVVRQLWAAFPNLRLDPQNQVNFDGIVYRRAKEVWVLTE